ncbi:MAG: hypothetical protein PHR28_06755 [candidate division Zixibacteria bacterium]|nr:hypothetical protein [candidate division Zixibacteria bacterium]
MAEADKKSQPFESSDERFRYVGFDVYTGKIGNLFKSDDERKSLVAKVMSKFGRSEGEVRDHCTLMEERVSKGEKMFLTVVSILMVVSLFLPWFSGYYEIVNTKQVPIESAAVDSTGAKLMEMTTVTTVTHDNRSVSGLGTLAGIGDYGGKVFSSGFALMLSGLLIILYVISCPVLAVFNLYLLYKVKMPNPDQYALYLKRMLRYNWIPVLLWLAMLLLAFMGGSYGFGTKGLVKQVGESYGIGAFIGLCSFGVYLSLGSFLLMALKGKEI